MKTVHMKGNVSSGYDPREKEKAITNGRRSALLANGKKTTEKTAADELMHTIESAFSEMSSFVRTAAEDAEDAGQNARAASEVVRPLSKEDASNGESGSGDLTTTPPRDKKQSPPPGFNGTATTSDGPTQKGQQWAPENKFASNETASKTVSNPRVNGHSMDCPLPDEQTPNIPDQTGSGRKRKIYSPERQIKQLSTADRLAQSHAEEVLSLSLELERTKQAFEREQNAHQQTKAALKETRSKNSQLEAQVQKMLHDMETERQDSGRKLERLDHELSQAQIRVETADQDAQLALDLAKRNSEDREQIETWLERALQEIQVLKNQQEHLSVSPDGAIHVPSSPKQSPTEMNPPTRPKNTVVRFADAPTYLASQTDVIETPRSQPSKSMVAAGRSLLRRAAAASTPDGNGDDAVHLVALTPEKSAERRKMLQRRLEELDRNGLEIPTPNAIVKAPPPSVHHGIDMGYATKAMEHCHSVVSLLRESGKRLGFGGHWFTGTPPKKVSDDVNVEAMTRQYCQSVEVKLGRQKDDMRELEALCDFLEQKLVCSNSMPSPKSM